MITAPISSFPIVTILDVQQPSPSHINNNLEAGPETTTDFRILVAGLQRLLELMEEKKRRSSIPYSGFVRFGKRSAPASARAG